MDKIIEMAEKIVRDTDKLVVLKPGTIAFNIAVSCVKAALLTN